MSALPESADNMDGLFRSQVLTAQQERWLGEVLFARPLSFKLMGFFALFVILFTMAFSYFGTYTTFDTVTGEVEPTQGAVKIYPLGAGEILQINFREGATVKRGQAMFVITNEKRSSIGETQAMISQSVSERKRALIQELNSTLSLQRSDRAGLERKIATDRDALINADQVLETQRKRVLVAQDVARRYRELLAQQFVSEADTQEKEAELLDQQSRLQSLEGSKISDERDLAAAENELRDLPLKSRTDQSQIETQYRSADEDLSESEAKRRTVIVAPYDGTLTSIVVHVGQQVSAEQPIAVLLPKSAVLHAILYANTKAVGFVKVGDAVDIRYEAYPFQKYGSYSGRVSEISHSPLTPSELFDIGEVLNERSTSNERGEPVYRISVDISGQYVLANGKKQPLQPGMLLEADILHDTRRLYQWVLEPLYSLEPPDFQVSSDGS